MADTIKVLDVAGVKVLFDLLSLQDYPNNDVLMAVINAIDETKADKTEVDKQVEAGIEAAISNIGAASKGFGDHTSLFKSIGEQLKFYQNPNNYTLALASLKVPTYEELIQGYQISFEEMHDNFAIFNPVTYGLECLPKEYEDEIFFNDAFAWVEENVALLLKEQILFVYQDTIINEVPVSRGTYFIPKYQDSIIKFVTGFRVNNFNFNSGRESGNDLFVGTMEEYNTAFLNGEIPLGAVVIITDMN